jgi:hypothetical protein
MPSQGQAAKNSRKALTSELAPITDMVRPRGNTLRLPSAAKPLRGSWSDRPIALGCPNGLACGARSSVGNAGACVLERSVEADERQMPDFRSFYNEYATRNPCVG